MRRLPLGLAMLWLASTACNDPDRDLPSTYRAVAVPQRQLAAPESRARGRALFLAHCAFCHGEKADGEGVRSQWLSTRPVAFTSAAWRATATPRKVFFWIREGVRGTPMPAWKSLSEQESWDLVAYVLSVAEPAR